MYWACHVIGMVQACHRAAVLALLIGLAAAVPALAAPPSDGKDAFGIPMGAPIRKVEGAKPFKPGWYAVASPPKPDPRFKNVAVEAFSDTGVCVVQAVSPEVQGDADGAKIRQAIDRLADDFSVRYGQPEKLDVCTGLACAPDLWGEDMQTGERRYGYRWSMHNGPPGSVREVSVVALAHTVSSFVFVVQFDSSQLTACHMEETPR
jgi:hypothetical protein